MEYDVDPNKVEAYAWPVSNLCSRPSDSERLAGRVRTHKAEEGTKNQTLVTVNGTKVLHTTGKENMKLSSLKGPGRKTLSETSGELSLVSLPQNDSTVSRSLVPKPHGIRQ